MVGYGCRYCTGEVAALYVYRPTHPRWAAQKPFMVCAEHREMYEADPFWGALNIVLIW